MIALAVACAGVLASAVVAVPTVRDAGHKATTGASSPLPVTDSPSPSATAAPTHTATPTAGPTPTTGPPAGAGGSLNVLMVSDFDHLDPARNYVSQALNFSRLLYRTLTTYKSVAGGSGLDLVPDLATNLGEPSNNGKTWTFHLKKGLKYEDGTTITSQDIKYNVERSFSDLLPEGPQYARQFLVGGDSYPGPYKDGGQGLASIVTPDATTIIFQLKSPHGDFNYTTALPTFSPVPKAMDTGVNYDKHVFSSGPYKIESYVAAKQMILVRNGFWSRETDTARAALPDTVNVTFGLDPSIIDQRILASTGPDSRAVQLDTSIQPENVAKVIGSSQYASRTVGGSTGFLRYIAINTSHKPFDNLKVRQAISYCTDKQAQQTARGGHLVGGDITQQILVPSVKGYQKYDPLGLDSTPQGDPAKGKALLAQSGVKLPLNMTFQANDTGKGVKQATAFQAAMKRCGINVTVNNLPATSYYSTVGQPNHEADALIAGWGPDWPSASTVIPPLFDSRQIKPAGNQIFSMYQGADASALDRQMDDPSSDPSLASATAKWTALDHAITDRALFVPLLSDKAQYIWGNAVRHAYIHAFFGDLDMVALGVR